MSDNPYYRWFPSDWFGSETRLLLTGSQTATYRDIIDRCMEHDGRWPVTIDRASILLATSMRQPQEVRDDIVRLLELECISDGDGSYLSNKRAMKEARHRNKVSKARKAAAHARWNADAEQEETKGNANAMQMQSVCNAPPEPELESKATTRTKEKEPPPPTARTREPVEMPTVTFLDDNALVCIMQDYNDVLGRNGGRRCSTMTGMRRARLNESATLHEGLRTPDGWRGVFDRASRSDWLCGREPGRNGKTFTGLSLEFIAHPEMVTKLLEGAYDNGDKKKDLLEGWI